MAGNNDLTAGKNEIFFAQALDAAPDGPILLTTAVANRGYLLQLVNCHLFCSSHVEGDKTGISGS